jgi:predicted transcriptional regulator
MPSARPAKTNTLELAAEILSAYVTKNALPVPDLPGVIGRVHAALQGLLNPQQAEPALASATPTPSQIRKSVTPDGLISFIDGRHYKTLKRHVKSHGFDEHSYRQRYGLPASYPMVAASYSAQRSAVAKAGGLGQVRQVTAEATAKPKHKGAEKSAARTRGRKAKA